MGFKQAQFPDGSYALKQPEQINKPNGTSPLWATIVSKIDITTALSLRFQIHYVETDDLEIRPVCH
jgi:hypothetical protein